MSLRPTKARDRATTFESLLARGVRTLQLPERTARRCRNCGESFDGLYLAVLEDICPRCVEENVRLTEEQARESRAEERRRQLAAMGIEGRLRDCTFGAFVDAEQPEAASAARTFVAEWPGSHGLAFLGDKGTGKTHLAVAILLAIAAWGEDGRYVYWPGLVAQVALDWSSADRLLPPLERTPLVVLDDIGRERAKDDSVWPMLKDRLFNERAVRGFPTIFCANLSRDSFGAWLGDAGASRVLSAILPPIAMVPGDRRFRQPGGSPKPESLRDARTACVTCQGAGWVVDADSRLGHVERLRKCPSCQGRRY